MAAEGAAGARRRAWVMWLKPGHEAEYKQKHDEIWPELVEGMRAAGIRNYSIYRHGLTLFAYLELDGTAPDDRAPDELTWRWWRMMEPLMECNEDSSPRQGELEEVFHMD